MNFQTVLGTASPEDVELADAHAHAWIVPPEGVDPEARIQLDDFDTIIEELTAFRKAGGSLLVDCQPGGCGRDAGMLARLSEATGVLITAVTGFHLQKYYPADAWLWHVSAKEAAAHFKRELLEGTVETVGSGRAVRATIIKIGYPGSIEGQVQILMEAAAQAAHETGATILFHTEQGRGVERLLPFFADRGIPPGRLYLCHVDKRVDIGLHRELTQAGALLGYDTFARPKYNPDQGAWRLIAALAADGLWNRVAIGLDLAFPETWRAYGGEPGLIFLPTDIVARLRREGYSEEIVRALTAGNIAHQLVWQVN